MTLRTLLRLSSLPWAVPLLIAAVALTWLTTLPAEPGYALAAQVRASEAMMLAYPVLTLGACVSAHRLHSSGILNRPIGRPRVFAGSMGPIVLGGVALIIAAALQLVAAGGLRHFSWGLFGVAAAWVFFSTILGAVVGRLGPLRGTAPVSVVVPYVLVGFPPAFTPPWLRHLFGLTSGCCRIDQVLDPRMVVGAVAFMLGLTLLVLAAGWGSAGHGRPALASSLAALVLGGTAVATVDGLEYESTRPRPGDPACRDLATTQVCVWPEHEAALQEGLPTMEAVIAAAKDAGLILPIGFVETSGPTSWPLVPLKVRPDLPSAALGYSLASSITPEPTAECLQKITGQPDADGTLLLYEVRPVTTAWLLEQADVGAAPIGPGPGAEELLADLEQFEDGGAEILRQWQQDLASCQAPRALVD